VELLTAVAAPDTRPAYVGGQTRQTRRPAVRPAPAWLRRLGRVAGWLGAVLAVVVLVGTLTIPTTALVQSLLARVTPPDGPSLAFERAVLRPWGLRLDGVVLRAADGETIVQAEWLRLRPSFWGLLRDGTGRPWQVAAGVCDGRVDASVTAGSTEASITAEWQDLDIATCLPPGQGLNLTGRTSGTARARGGNGVRPTGEGELHVRDGVWEREDVMQEMALDVLHADDAAIRWNLVEDRLTVEGFELHGPEVELRGGGSVRLTGTPARNQLDLRFVAQPGPAVPEPLQRLLDRLPPAPGADPLARTLVVKGTAADPQVVTR
jgi:type II secretion system protein N